MKINENDPWPSAVPILDGKDFTKGTLHRGEKSCLLGWKEKAFDTDQNNAATPFTEAVDQAIGCAAKDLGAVNADHVVQAADNGYAWAEVPRVNDSRHNPPTLLARIWNLAMAKLGYTQGNPETKTLKALEKQNQPSGGY